MQAPWEVVIGPSSVVLAGRSSESVTPVAVSGPSLRTVTVKVAVSPRFTTGRSTVWATTRSAAGAIVVLATALVSLPGTGSKRPPLTVALFCTVLFEALGRTVARIVTVAVAPLAIAPSAQVTVCPTTLQPPCELVGEPWIWRVVGRVSVIATPVCAEGPSLRAVSV